MLMQRKKLRRHNGGNDGNGGNGRLDARAGCGACVKNACQNVKSDRPSVEQAVAVGLFLGALVACVLVAAVAVVARAGA